jgi:DNA-binding winged helix-turn-helix (wHTH) protein
VFKDETRRLLIEFLKVPDRILSHEDIRQDVMFLRDDEDNVDESGVTERQIIDRARKALKEQNSRYDIKNLRKRGYKLIDRETLQTLHDPPKKPGKKRRKFCNVCNV